MSNHFRSTKNDFPQTIAVQQRAAAVRQARERKLYLDLAVPEFRTCLELLDSALKKYDGMETEEATSMVEALCRTQCTLLSHQVRALETELFNLTTILSQEDAMVKPASPIVGGSH